MLAYIHTCSRDVPPHVRFQLRATSQGPGFGGLAQRLVEQNKVGANVVNPAKVETVSEPNLSPAPTTTPNAASEEGDQQPRQPHDEL